MNTINLLLVNTINRSKPLFKWNIISLMSGHNKVLLTKLRFSLLKFPVVTGRYEGIPSDEKHCTFCNTSLIGYEFHYLLVCKKISSYKGKIYS